MRCIYRLLFFSDYHGSLVATVCTWLVCLMKKIVEISFKIRVEHSYVIKHEGIR